LEVDATFSYFAKPVIFGTLAAKLAGVRYRYSMIEGLGYAFAGGDRSSVKRRIIRHILLRLYRLSQSGTRRVFFLNPDDQEEFVSHRLVRADQAVRLPGIGVDLERLVYSKPVGAPITFVLAARLILEKGITDFVEAARRIKDRHRDTRFILLGGLDDNPSGLSREQLEEWVASGVLEWPGMVDDVGAWLMASSVYVLPSFYREGVPRSIQEAMAVGRPVVTTNTPGCRETVRHGENGFLVPPRDVAALVEAMSAFVVQPDLLEAMGKASRRLAEDRFDVHRINCQLIGEMARG
jgi:glycosyltransferase involved in cell wall biosynthesis